MVAATKRVRRVNARIVRGETGPDGQTRLATHWRIAFFETLAETSNVSQACHVAGVTPGTVYEQRRKDSGFARKWMDALCEGFDLLEMDLLHRLRSGEAKEAEGEAPIRKFDNANAMRLLAAHRATVARGRALRDNRDEKAVLDSIDAFIDRMRNRSIANAKLLASPVTDETG